MSRPASPLRIRRLGIRIPRGALCENAGNQTVCLLKTIRWCWVQAVVDRADAGVLTVDAGAGIVGHWWPSPMGPRRMCGANPDGVGGHAGGNQEQSG